MVFGLGLNAKESISYIKDTGSWYYVYNESGKKVTTMSSSQRELIGWGSDSEAKAKLLEAGCNYMLTKDLNDGVGIHSDYVYLGYKRTDDPNEAIRDIVSIHDEDWTTYTKNGATYYKIEGNLNSWTHKVADDIYLFYTKDSKAGSPITSLGTSGSVANWSHGEGNRYVVKTVLNQHDEASDLNNNCGYQRDYIYLLITRDKQDEKAALASMIGNGSVIIIVAFALLSAVAIAWVCITQKKRRNQVAVETEIVEKSITETDKSV